MPWNFLPTFLGRLFTLNLCINQATCLIGVKANKMELFPLAHIWDPWSLLTLVSPLLLSNSSFHCLTSLWVLPLFLPSCWLLGLEGKNQLSSFGKDFIWIGLLNLLLSHFREISTPGPLLAYCGSMQEMAMRQTFTVSFKRGC